jgi:hypothetical protein
MENPKRFWTLAILVALLAAAVFLPGLGGGFIFDDRPNIVQNAALHLSKLNLTELPFAVYSFQPGHGSRMLAMATFAFDYWRSGLDPRAFKATNIAIHAITTIALAWLYLGLLTQAGWARRRAWVAAAVLAAAWAVHPLQVSSVLYIVQRMQTLVTLFGVLTLIAYLRMRQAQILGERSRRYALLALMCWALGLASKEDAALYPLYALAVEVTLCRFECAKAFHSRLLRGAYATLVVACVCAFVFYVVPKHWDWGAMPGREFTSPQRLMTQARVVVMYLGQSVVPLPSHMPFYYDVIPVSKGILDPPTTLFSAAVLAALLAWAWAWRNARPAFTLGILLFFTGHLLTSNILNLELAFEHRNQFPMIGIVLAAGEVWNLIWKRAGKPRIELLASCALVSILAATAVTRAYNWGDPVRFGEYSLRVSPNSPRAWMALGSAYYELSNGQPQSPYFKRSIEINQAGARVTGSPSLYSNVVLYKSRRGDVANEDWKNLLDSVRSHPMTLQTQFIVDIMLDNMDAGVPLDENGMVSLIEAVVPRGSFRPDQYRRFGAYLFNDTYSPRKAYRYLALAVMTAPAGDPETETMLRQLAEAGREDWVDRLRKLPRPPGTH